jgi:hypothetical protein
MMRIRRRYSSASRRPSAAIFATAIFDVHGPFSERTRLVNVGAVERLTVFSSLVAENATVGAGMVWKKSPYHKGWHATDRDDRRWVIMRQPTGFAGVSQSSPACASQAAMIPPCSCRSDG